MVISPGSEERAANSRREVGVGQTTEALGGFHLGQCWRQIERREPDTSGYWLEQRFDPFGSDPVEHGGAVGIGVRIEDHENGTPVRRT